MLPPTHLAPNGTSAPGPRWVDERQVRLQIDRAVGLALFDRSFAERLLGGSAPGLENEGYGQPQLVAASQNLHDFARQTFDQFWARAPVSVPSGDVTDTPGRDQTLGRVLCALSERLLGPDVTTLAAERDALAARAAVLEATVRQQDALLTTAAHDLRNSLMTVYMRVDLLREQMDDEGWRDQGSVAVVDGLTKIQVVASNMKTLLDDLLGLARLQAGQRLNLVREPTDLVALTRRVAAEYGDANHRILIVASKRKVLGVWDRWRLERVLAELLRNALKYSPERGDIRLGVAREVGDGAGWAVLSVRDYGLGIPASELRSVFEHFQRGTNAAGIDGLGIGLASARQIALEHGGSLRVESREGVGSTFTLRLPL
jgi:signal transduction histidine kinase